MTGTGGWVKSLKVGVSKERVIIDDDVHSLDINTTTEDINSDQNTFLESSFLESFEGGVSADSIEERNLKR